MTKFQRGDIVSWCNDEDLANLAVSEEFKATFRARRYVVLELVAEGFRFRTGPHTEIWRPASYRIWLIGQSHDAQPVVAFACDMIATGETATETT
jgi:hypothetical protein